MHLLKSDVDKIFLSDPGLNSIKRIYCSGIRLFRLRIKIYSKIISKGTIVVISRILQILNMRPSTCHT